MKILSNGLIYTLDPFRPVVSALVIDQGKVIAAGEKGELTAQFGSQVQVEDLDGRTVLPGLTDAHFHLQYYALGLQKVDCETTSLSECLARVSRKAESLPKGDWVLGHGWNQNDWSLGSPDGLPTAADLDKVTVDHPSYLTAKSLHAGWANSLALQLAGITINTPDPAGGKIQRDESGQPTGVLLESAMQLVNQVIPEPDVDEIAAAINAAQPILWQIGLTGIHDFDRRNCFVALQKLYERGDLRMRVVKSIPLEDLPFAVGLGLRTGYGNDWLQIGSVKVFMDGALGPRTAAMFQPYLNEPENRGILIFDSEELFEHGRQAAVNGLSLAVHAIGDRANHEALNALEQLRSLEASMDLKGLRHRIEHVQLLHPDDVGRLGELNVIASMQPVHAVSDMHMADRYWGERSSLSYAWRSQKENRAMLAFGSDAPVESPNPFWGLHAALTRQREDGSPGADGWYPEQRLTLKEAVEGFTTGAAYAARMENRLGRLVEGYLADLIVLEQDPFKCSSKELRDLKPGATMIGGEWVWRK